MFCNPKSPETGEREPLIYIKAADTSYVLTIHASPAQLYLTLVPRYGDSQSSEFRREQLEQRRFEIYSGIDALKKLSVEGDRGSLSTIDDSELDWQDFRGKIGFDTLQITGHSFGGATLFSLLSQEPADGFAPLPVTHALFLDPWLEPFEKPDPIQATRNVHVKKVILNSEGWTLWREHTAHIVEVAKDWGNVPLYTIGMLDLAIALGHHILTTVLLARATHQSFSDYGVLWPTLLVGKELGILKKISELSVAFLDDGMGDALARSTTREMEIEKVKGRRGKEESRLVANAGDVVVH